MNDRDRLVELICTALGKELEKNKIFDFPVVEEAIVDYLIEDGVIVPVRCGECAYFGKNKEYRDSSLLYSFCYKFHHNITKNDDYCSYGKRKENGDE